MPVFNAEGSDVRHENATCDALKAEVSALHPEAKGDALLAACGATWTKNTGALRERTHRCTAGCWKEYVLDERKSIATGERFKGKDDAFHAASVVNDASARDKASARRAAKKRGASLEELAAGKLAAQAKASS